MVVNKQCLNKGPRLFLGRGWETRLKICRFNTRQGQCWPVRKLDPKSWFNIVDYCVCVCQAYLQLDCNIVYFIENALCWWPSVKTWWIDQTCDWYWHWYEMMCFFWGLRWFVLFWSDTGWMDGLLIDWLIDSLTDLFDWLIPWLLRDESFKSIQCWVLLLNLEPFNHG